MTDYNREEEAYASRVAAAQQKGVSLEQHMLEEAEPMMQFFRYEHLPPHLQSISQMHHQLAARITRELRRNPERTVALRKLLEGKDAAVRSALVN